jgi:hypothetical protein
MRRTREAAHRFALACVAVLACVVASSAALAVESDSTIAERRIKAAFLSKFTEYVEWPSGASASPDAPLRIAVLGDDAMAGELRTLLANRRSGSRPFEVSTLADAESAAGIDVLFVGRAKRAALDTGRVPPGQPMLVVSEVAGALDHGATINFLVLDGRVRFEVSLEDAERRHLKLGSGLLTVAQNLRRSGE